MNRMRSVARSKSRKVFISVVGFSGSKSEYYNRGIPLDSIKSFTPNKINGGSLLLRHFRRKK